MGLTVLLLTIGAVAFIPGLRRHGKNYVLLLGAAGLTMISSVAFMPEGAVTEAVEASMTIAGGAVLICAHFMNAYFCCCPICTEKSTFGWKAGN
jgi:hypothetical protein